MKLIVTVSFHEGYSTFTYITVAMIGVGFICFCFKTPMFDFIEIIRMLFWRLLIIFDSIGVDSSDKHNHGGKHWDNSDEYDCQYGTING